MKPLTLLFVVAVAALAMPATALAQYRGTSDNINGPTVSPYLNLLSNNNGANVGSYQTLVKPLIDANSAIKRQGGAIQQLQQQSFAAPSGGNFGGGHASYFMNYSHYFPGAGRRR